LFLLVFCITRSLLFDDDLVTCFLIELFHLVFCITRSYEFYCYCNFGTVFNGVKHFLMHTAAMVAETDGGGDPKWMVYNVIF
jgi:hypothetical protein